MGRQGAVAGIVVALLLVVATVALRGHVPGVGPASHAAPPNSPASVTFVVGLVVASAVVAALAVVTRWRQLGNSTPSSAGRPDWFRATAEGPSRRVVIIALIVFAAWLLAVAWLGGLGVGGNRSDSEALDKPAGSTPDTSPATTTPPRAPSRPAPPDDSSHLLWYLSAASLIFLLVLVVVSVHAARVRRRNAVPPPVIDADYESPASEIASESLARAAEVGLAEVNDPSRDPRAAIIACYAAMERELARVPDAVPQDCDTATEVLERAVQRHALGPDSATKLVELFDEARFSPHVMDEGHREEAVVVLERVLGEIRSMA